VDSHPRRKNKDAPRVGYPASSKQRMARFVVSQVPKSEAPGAPRECGLVLGEHPESEDGLGWVVRQLLAGWLRGRRKCFSQQAFTGLAGKPERVRAQGSLQVV